MKKVIGVFAALVLLTVSVMAAVTPDPYSAYASGATKVGTTLAYAVVGCHSSNAGTPVVTYINALSDHATPTLTYYSAGVPVMVTGANSTVTIPAATNGISGYTANAIIVIQHMATDTYERRILGTCTSSNIVVSVAPTTATAAGDRIWLCTVKGTIPLTQNTVKELNGPGIIAGQANKPFLIEVDNTTSAAACNINVCATFVK